MRVLNKYSHWWKKEEKEWAWQDRHGDWWISKSDDKGASVKSPNKKRQKQRSNSLSVEAYLAIFGAAFLGIIAGSIVAMLLS